MTSLQKFVAIEGVDDRLPEKHVWGVLLDLFKAVGHLHDAELIHFDIKLVLDMIKGGWIGEYAAVKAVDFI